MVAAPLLTLTIAPCPRFAMAGGQGLHEQVGGAQVDLDVRVEGRLVGVGGVGEVEHAGVVDEDVDVPGAFGQRRHLGRPGEVGGFEAGRAARLLDPAQRGLRTLAVAAVHDDAGAAPGQGQGGGAADARGGSGDQRCPAGEVGGSGDRCGGAGEVLVHCGFLSVGVAQ
ncbi:hypothetical protein GCM10020001_099000 [Nonomuraea salmonea]